MARRKRQRTKPLLFKCPVCGTSMQILTRVHIAKHGYETKEDFLKDYPEFNELGYWGDLRTKMFNK
jgi:hypothetical protein